MQQSSSWGRLSSGSINTMLCDYNSVVDDTVLEFNDYHNYNSFAKKCKSFVCFPCIRLLRSNPTTQSLWMVHIVVSFLFQTINIICLSYLPMLQGDPSHGHYFTICIETLQLFSK